MATTDNFISRQTISYTEYEEDIVSWLETLDDYPKWKDFFEGSDGTIIIDMISSKTASEAYKILTSLQEAYLLYATKRSSAIANAQDKGYNTGRGTNIRIYLTLTPNVTASFEKFSIIGTCGEYDLVLDSDTYFTKNQQIQVCCYIGNLLESTIVANTSDLSIFRYTNNNISNTCRLLLNNTEVPLGEQLVDLLDNKYVLMSNAFGGVDAMYLNNSVNATHVYNNADNLTLQYIEYDEIDYTDATVEFYYGDVESFDSQLNMVSQEQLNSIQLKAPLFAESNKTIVAREDFRKVFLQLLPDIKDTNSIDYSNPIVQVTYALSDRHILTDTQYNEIYNYLSKARVFGIPMCYISHPSIMHLNLNIILTMKSASSAFDADSYVSNITNNYEYILATKLDLSSIEDSLKDNSSLIKTARVYFASEEWSSSKSIILGSVIKPTVDSRNIYIATDFVHVSGDTEPTWPTIIDSTIIDNDIIWKCISISQNSVPMVWLPDNEYNLFNKVSPSEQGNYVYQCVGFMYTSGNTEPIWPLVENNTIIDNNIMWISIPKNVTKPIWSSNSNIQKGDIVNSTITSSFSYQCIGYAKITSSTEPEWSGSSIIADGVKYTCYDESTQQLDLSWDNYCVFENSITMVGS